MTPEMREQVRLSLLRYIAQAERFASARLLMGFLHAEGLQQCTMSEITQELQYLLDKKLVTKVEKTISPELAAFRITADGRDHLAQLTE